MADSAYDTAQSPYTFREDDQAAADRQHKLDVATLNAITKVTGSGAAAPAPTAAPAGATAGPSPQQMGVQAPSVAGSMQSALSSYAPTPGQAPEGIQDFVSFGSNPIESALRTKAAQANMTQLDNPAAAFDVGAAASRESLDIAQRNQREQTRDDLARTYGGNASQVTTALRDADQQAILDRRGLDSSLATGRAQAAQQGTAQAIQNALGFAGLGSQEKIAQAQLQQSAKAQASQEKLAYAGLDLEKTKFAAADANAKKGLDLEASAQALQAQGMAKEDAYRYASLAQAKDLAEKGLTLEQSAQQLQKQGMSQQDAQYYAGLAQQEKLQTQQLQTQLDVAKMQIGSTERLQANQQAYDSAQAGLTRTLQKEMQGNEIAAQTALQRSQQDFQAIMADKGFLQAKDLETLKNEFAQDLQRNGFTQETAMQAAELQAQALQAKSQQEFEANQADLNRKFTSGERVATEDFTKNLQTLESQQQERMAKITSDLNLTAIDKQAGYQQALQAAQQAHETALQKNSLDAAGAQQAADQAFQKTMQANGFSQQQILQAQTAQYQAAETDKQLHQQYTMFLAQEAQQDKQFAADLGIKQEQVDAQKEQFAQGMGVTLQQLGIQQDQWNTMKADQQFQTDLNLAMTGIQMWNGQDPSAIAPFVERLATTMGTKLGMDPAKLQEAIKQSLGGTATGGTGTVAASAGAVDKAQAIVDQLAPVLPAKLNPDLVKDILQKVAAGDTKSIGELALSGMGMNKLPGWSQYMARGTTQIGADFTAYDYLVNQGVPSNTAFDIVSAAIGPDRLKTAYKAMTGKAWGG